MKVLYIGNGLTHYYNLVLSRLNNEADIDLVVIAPASSGNYVGDGVHQTKDGINFKVIELREKRRFKLYATFDGLAKAIRQERPDVIITLEPYLLAFKLELSVLLAIKSINSAIILKSIPFRYVNYQKAKKNIALSNTGFSSAPNFINKLLLKTKVINYIRFLLLYIKKNALKIPDAHVNYVEAYDYWQSYGVSKEKIFITRNSPDTDMLFVTRRKIAQEQEILPNNPHRILHVGRLVEWKRVDMLIRAFSAVKEKYTDAELLVIGMGPDEKKLKDLANNLKLGESVVFLGGIYDQEKLGKYYLSSSLYVLAGMGGLSINEAMSYGLPILCSVCDGTEKSLVKEGVNGKYFKDGIEKDLIEKIMWFFEHPGRSKNMGIQSEEIIRNDVNIHTVINGYLDAIHYASKN